MARESSGEGGAKDSDAWAAEMGGPRRESARLFHVNCSINRVGPAAKQLFERGLRAECIFIQG